MKVRIGGLLAAFVIFLLFLIAYLPASQVINRINLPANIKIYGISGTIWNGRAQQIEVNQLPVQDVDWSINPLALFIGRLNIDVRAGNARDAQAISFAGPISTRIFSEQNLQLSNFELYLPVDTVLARVPLPLPVNASGRFKATIAQLDYNERCNTLEGQGSWLNATVAGTKGPIDFGSYTAQLGCTEGNFAIEVSEPNKLGLSMQAEVNALFNQFSVAGQFKPDDTLPEEVHQAARLFGQPNNQGYTTFEL